MKTARVDIAGIGENAVDHVLRLSQFPAPDGKVQIESASHRLGGQIATAIVACRKWGLKTRYIGSCGDDACAATHEREFARLGVEAHLVRVRRISSRLSYILVDGNTGSRAVLSRRERQLQLPATRLHKSWVVHSRLLLLDAENPEASLRAARWAREAGIPAMSDFDQATRAVASLLPLTDYPVISSLVATTLAKRTRLLEALPALQKRHGFRAICATSGPGGALLWDGRRFWYSASFRVRAVDTTGAGDLFHAGFAYGLLQGWRWQEVLDFGCGAAGLNCTAEGARGRIGTLREIGNLLKMGGRNAAQFTPAQLKAAALREKGRHK